jgi:tetratricopeptide (TPR) repeat protein
MSAASDAFQTGVSAAGGAGRRQRYVPVVGPRLKRLLAVVFALFALLVVNSVYLLSITIAGATYQNYFYLLMFLLHLVLGFMIVVPVVVYGVIHMRNAANRPNKRAIRAGYALFTTALVVLISGFVLLTRADGALATHAPFIRSAAYWLHVIGPVLAVWLFILHRLAGRKIKWRTGVSWAAVAAAFAGVMLLVHRADPRIWNVAGPVEGERYFFPSLARTSTGNFIPEHVLHNDRYCLDCHADVHASWSVSAHRFASFNNPAYFFSVKETREFAMARDGDVNASRWCAGCHDPVPFFSGKFSDPHFDMVHDPSAHAGITCTVCHSISHVNSTRGNADYTIDEPIHYPFAFSGNPVLAWANRQLIKAKPEFHKQTFLKPLHQSAEFCSTCHKVHLPPELNDYKWLRGQNHFDSFWLSGVSGYGIASFYYPAQAEANCQSCHMPAIPSRDFAARVRDDSNILKTLDHMFPSANTAIAKMVGIEDWEEVVRAHEEFRQDALRVDIFGVREGGTIDGALHAPLKPDVPALTPGESYLLEAVIRTVRIGHHFTQGTADSNEVWLDVTVTSGDRVIGRSGGRDPRDNAVDRWAHFVNVFMLDREGNRINRRNPQNIFVPLYNNQIPPGAASTVHYRLDLPKDVREPIVVDVKLQYRKFDTEYMALVHDEPAYYNNLPISTLAHDTVTFPVAGGPTAPVNNPSTIPEWQRWNDYGIGLLLKEGRGQLRQAQEAFARVEALGRPEGPINLARVYIREGRVTQEAPAALSRAADFDPPPNQWQVLWFGGLVNKQNGLLDEAIESFRQIVAGGFEQAAGRNFDFSKDWRVLNELGGTLYDRARQERGADRRPIREEMLREAKTRFLRTLELDPEDLTAHYNLQQIYADLGDLDSSERHRLLHARFKPDDNARDIAVAAARRKYPWANHAAEPVVIYDLRRLGAYGLEGAPALRAGREDVVVYE